MATADIEKEHENEDGTIVHAEAKIGNSIVGGFDTREGWPNTPCFLRLYIEDADAVYHQALSAGAIAVTEMTNLSWGDRGGRVRDPPGNIWWIQSRVEQVDQDELAKRAIEKQYLDARCYTRESLDREMRRRGISNHDEISWQKGGEHGNICAGAWGMVWGLVLAKDHSFLKSC